MKLSRYLLLSIPASLILGLVVASAQTPRRLTLSEAHDLAVRNHPRLSAAQFSAEAANEATKQVRSAYFPSLFGNLTGAEAGDNTRIAAGGLNNPTILSRYANGVNVSQLLTDFGRGANLTKSSQLLALAAGENVEATRAQVLIQVDQAYFSGLRAQAVLKVADEAVVARQTVLEQVTALEKSGLKSILDERFAEVNLSQAKLLLLRAQNDLSAAFAQLSTALGYSDLQAFELTEEPVPDPLPNDLEALIRDAGRRRPDLVSIRFNRDAAFKLADAEKSLRLPSVSAVASFGYTPFHVNTLQNHYAAVGFNISLPIFNGHLFAARRAEAEFKALAADRTVIDLENRINRDVRIAWLNTNTAFQGLSVTAQLLDNATQALDLAQRRYNLGLDSIVELTQAELFKTEAEIANVSAKYEYQVRRAELDYSVGVLH